MSKRRGNEVTADGPTRRHDPSYFKATKHYYSIAFLVISTLWYTTKSIPVRFSRILGLLLGYFLVLEGSAVLFFYRFWGPWVSVFRVSQFQVVKIRVPFWVP